MYAGNLLSSLNNARCWSKVYWSKLSRGSSCVEFGVELKKTQFLFLFNGTLLLFQFFLMVSSDIGDAKSDGSAFDLICY
jgi:hypothetical protein